MANNQPIVRDNVATGINVIPSLGSTVQWRDGVNFTFRQTRMLSAERKIVDTTLIPATLADLLPFVPTCNLVSSL